MTENIKDFFKVSNWTVTEWFVLIAHIVASIVILIILYFAIYRTYRIWYAKRKSFFVQEKETSAQNLIDSESLKKKAQLQVSHAETMIKELLITNQKEMQKKLQIAVAQGEKEKKELINQGHSRVKQMELNATTEMKETIVKNSLILAEKIIRKKITRQDQQKLIKEFIKNFDEK